MEDQILGETMNFFSELKFKEIAKEIAAASHVLYRRGWVPATSGNFSMRIDDAACGITQSGKDKEKLREQDVVAVDFEGRPLTKGRPSAETMLHTLLYRHFSEIEAVLHVHSPNSTVLSRLLAGQSQLILKDYELLKAFHGISRHDAELAVPIFENTQEMAALSKIVEAYLNTGNTPCHGCLIRGHGLYVWGRTMEETLRQLEAFEFLLGCEIALHRL